MFYTTGKLCKWGVGCVSSSLATGSSWEDAVKDCSFDKADVQNVFNHYWHKQEQLFYVYSTALEYILGFVAFSKEVYNAECISSQERI